MVPHMFLYYFDMEPAGHYTDSMETRGDGVPDFDQFHHHDSIDSSILSNLSTATPVGIIDLECYSQVNHLSVEDNIMELSGDAITNPDL